MNMAMRLRMAYIGVAFTMMIALRGCGPMPAYAQSSDAIKTQINSDLIDRANASILAVTAVQAAHETRLRAVEDKMAMIEGISIAGTGLLAMLQLAVVFLPKRVP